MKKFNEIYNETYSFLKKYIDYHCKDEEDSHDLLQETYIALYEALYLNKNITNEKKYILGIAKRKIKDYYRKQYKEKKIKSIMVFSLGDNKYNLIDYIPSNLNVEKELINNIDLNYIFKKIKERDPLSIKIFFMYFYYGKSIKSIASNLHISESMVKNRLYRTINFLKRNREK